MTHKHRHDLQLSRPEAAEFLRNLADALEHGSDCMKGYGISLDELVKFKVKMDLGADEAAAVRFSGKGGRACCTDAVCDTCAACESYPGLKKRMQAHFKAMRDSLARGAMPAAETVDAFLLDSERMRSFPGHGEEFYDAFAELCARLRRAVDSADLTETASVTEDLLQAKKRCHASLK
jgi:XXXCH domain-containing protein